MIKFWETLLFLIVFILGAVAPSVARESARLIKTDKYEGVVFSSSYNSVLLGKDLAQVSRWTLDDASIAEAEATINKYMQASWVCAGSKLEDYKRQYLGLVGDKGDKIVWINYFLGSSPDTSHWQKDVVVVVDGGCNLFNIKVNLTTKQIFDLTVNGVGKS